MLWCRLQLLRLEYRIAVKRGCSPIRDLSVMALCCSGFMWVLSVWLLYQLKSTSGVWLEAWCADGLWCPVVSAHRNDLSGLLSARGGVDTYLARCDIRAPWVYGIVSRSQ